MRVLLNNLLLTSACAMILLGTLYPLIADALDLGKISVGPPYFSLLFIVLTWVGVGLVEVLRRLRVHPMQYLLVGAALCSFFLLLVSLSEHLPFGWSYLAAATACVLLLGYYASHMLGGLARGLPLGLGIALLYGLLYVLLQLEQTALAVGSVALFLVLTAVMVLTRKVNWYGLTPAQRSTPPAMPAAAPKDAP